MPLVLTTNAQIFCPHTGKGTTVPAHPKWTVNGGYVAVEGDTGTLTCPFVPVPCGGYTLQSMGLNATEIDGQKVILVTDFNTTFTGLPLLITDFHQMHDDSTPAPIPRGQSAPPATPEMADLVSPIVVAAPPAAPFSITTPSPVVFTFTLTTDYPLLWKLVLINSTLKTHSDLTNGALGAVVAPAGGSWSSPSLVVTLSLTPAFMTALTAGTHYFYMTGVSKRGLSSYAEAQLTVSP